MAAVPAKISSAGNSLITRPMFNRIGNLLEFIVGKPAEIITPALAASHRESQ
jgi:hypothetical protein